MSAWADLDKLATAKPRPDGSITVVARDDRPRADIEATRPLSIVLAICRVTRARQALAARHGGRGAVYYLCPAAPAFLVDAVSAAGGIVFDGATERVAPKALETTVQLDAACCDLATAVRRRLGGKSFDDALTIREAELRRAPIDRGDPAQLWPTVLELAALAGELLRERRPARWITVDDRPPLALDLGKARVLQPGKLALTLAEGGAGSMRMLIALERATATDGPVGRTMPLLTARSSVPLERVTWEPLLAAEVDHPDVPVIAYVEDRGEAIMWPDLGAPTPELRATAARNLAAIEPALEQLSLPFGRVARVSGDFYAAEKLLDPAYMKRVASHIGAGDVLVVGMPARGELIAIDAAIAMLDDVMHAFAGAVAAAYDRATARDRISKELIVYQGKPLGRVTDPR